MITEYFSNSIDVHQRNLNSLQEKLQSLLDYNQRALSLRSKLIDAGYDKRNAKNLTRQIKLPEFDRNFRHIEFEELIGEHRAGHFYHYFQIACKPGFQFKKSDIMDLIHLTHAYDCDLFRCDKNMASIMKDFEPFKGKLVSRFKDLPEKIEEKLRTKSSNLPPPKP